MELFQSTLPAWGETQKWGGRKSESEFQSTLPAWGETHFPAGGTQGIVISIHSPRMGRDPIFRPPILSHFVISIHSPRMGRDGVLVADNLNHFTFQSTLPAWGETSPWGRGLPNSSFQSTLPAWGETVRLPTSCAGWRNFNPLSPHGERRSASPMCWAVP